MEYILSQAETILLAKGLALKGKSSFFIEETLTRRGADPEHVSVALAEIVDEMANKAQRAQMIGLLFLVLGGAWALAVSSFGLFAQLEVQLSFFGALCIVYGPVAMGALWVCKGVFWVSKFT